MNRQDLAKAIAEKHGLTLSYAKELAISVEEIITDCLIRQERVILGFGVLKPEVIKGRRFSYPASPKEYGQTEDRYTIKYRQSATISRAFKDKPVRKSKNDSAS